MPLYIGDYLRDTLHLNTTQHGAYLLLIFAYWTTGPLIDNDEGLATIAKLLPKEWQKNRPTLERFFEVKDKFWHHKRVDSELEFAKVLTERRIEAGRLGGIAARGKSGRPHKNSKAISENSKQIANEWQNNTPSPSPSQSTERECVSENEWVKLPPWYPQSEEEAVAACMTCGIEEAFVRSTWNKGAGRGGMDAKSCQIRRFSNHVKTEWNYEQQRRTQTNQKPGRVGADRNAGTANAKTIGQYDGLGKLPSIQP